MFLKGGRLLVDADHLALLVKVAGHKFQENTQQVGGFRLRCGLALDMLPVRITMY